jgi:hypothetical protein
MKMTISMGSLCGPALAGHIREICNDTRQTMALHYLAYLLQTTVVGSHNFHLFGFFSPSSREFDEKG